MSRYDALGHLNVLGLVNGVNTGSPSLVACIRVDILYDHVLLEILEWVVLLLAKWVHSVEKRMRKTRFH